MGHGCRSRDSHASRRLLKYLRYMTDPERNSSLAVSTRDLVLAFFLAKGAAVLVAVLVKSGGKDESLALTVASVVAILVFFTLLLLTARCSLSHLLRVTRPSLPPWPVHTTLACILLVIPLGFLLRFGTGGLVLGTFQIIDPAAVAIELADVLSALEDPAYGLTWMLVLEMAAGAIQEELVYRQVLQSRLCARYGMVTGILIVSVLFCVMHLANPTTLLAGVFFGLLYVFTGRLWVPIAAHASANLALPILATPHITVTASGLASAMYASAVMLCLVLVAMFIAIRKRAIPPYERESVVRRGHADSAAK